MAGITFIKKDNYFVIDYIINRLLEPDIKKVLFDDVVGIQELRSVFYNPATVIYAIRHEGKPEPIGTVFFCGVVPYRDSFLYAIIFDKQNRLKGKLTECIEKIKKDIIARFSIHSCTASIIGKNEITEHMLEKLGFKKVGEKKEAVHSGGKYRDITIYQLCPVEKED